MVQIDDAVWCDGCGVEITWAPQLKGKRKYCCQDCQAELPCRCGERMEMEDERRGARLSSVDTLGNNLV
ncbi:MAG: hypothetical protein A2Z45_05015 [Chloroflexi bacterium RBG_19FT_COMBO_55_16]|nr:MAG: hypothetical protein A2Z45_05015 [Chloroflexi bacterium RBG_19FT_COMBO_55_16]